MFHLVLAQEMVQVLVQVLVMVQEQDLVLGKVQGQGLALERVKDWVKSL